MSLSMEQMFSGTLNFSKLIIFVIRNSLVNSHVYGIEGIEVSLYA